MSYIWPAGTPGTGIQRIELRLFSPTEFQVLTPFAYTDDEPGGSGTTVHVLGDAGSDPPGSNGITDLTSVPPFLWGLIASYGRQLPAALVHDQLYAQRPASGAARREAMDLADGIFLRALQDADLGEHRVPAFRARLLWAGLSAARYARVRTAQLAAVVAAVLAFWIGLVGVLALLGRALPLSDVVGRPWPWWVLSAVALALLVAGAVVNGRVTGNGGRLSSGLLVTAAVLVGLAAVWASLPWLPADWTPVDSIGKLVAWTVGAVLAAVLLTLRLPAADRLLPVILALAVPVATPVLVVTIPAQLLLWIPDALLHSAGGVPANPRPTIIR